MGAGAAVAEEVPDLTAEEVAGRVGVSVSTVRRWCQRGAEVMGRRVRLAGYRVGQNWRVSPEALEQFKRDCTGAGGEPTPAPTAKHEQAQAERDVAALREALEG